MIAARTIRVFRSRAASALFGFCALFSLVALSVIVIYLTSSSLPFLSRVGIIDFLFGMDYRPLATVPSHGIFPMIVTSLLVTLLSTALGAGLGLLLAIALFKFVPPVLVKPIKALIDLLSGIPSVVYGLFGLVVVVPFIRDFLSPTGVGYGILSASLILSLMILPMMVSTSLDALKAVDISYFEGAMALGSTSSEAVFKVVMPAAKSGIFAALVLSSGRALGETMAVIMVIGGSPTMPTSLTQSVRTLTANIALGAAELANEAFEALIATGLVLFLMSLAINVVFALLKKGRASRG